MTNFWFSLRLLVIPAKAGIQQAQHLRREYRYEMRSIQATPYRIVPFHKVFYGFWYSVLSSIALGIVSNPSGIEPGAEPVILLIFPFFFLMPLVMHFIFTRNSEGDLARILQFLDEKAQARTA